MRSWGLETVRDDAKLDDDQDVIKLEVATMVRNDVKLEVDRNVVKLCAGDVRLTEMSLN